MKLDLDAIEAAARAVIAIPDLRPLVDDWDQSSRTWEVVADWNHAELRDFVASLGPASALALVARLRAAEALILDMHGGSLRTCDFCDEAGVCRAVATATFNGAVRARCDKHHRSDCQPLPCAGALRAWLAARGGPAPSPAAPLADPFIDHGDGGFSVSLEILKANERARIEAPLYADTLAVDPRSDADVAKWTIAALCEHGPLADPKCEIERLVAIGELDSIVEMTITEGWAHASVNDGPYRELFATREAAIADGIAEHCSSFFLLRGEVPDVAKAFGGVFVDILLERADEFAYDNWGARETPVITDHLGAEGIAELRALLRGWAEKRFAGFSGWTSEERPERVDVTGEPTDVEPAPPVPAPPEPRLAGGHVLPPPRSTLVCGACNRSDTTTLGDAGVYCALCRVTTMPAVAVAVPEER